MKKENLLVISFFLSFEKYIIFCNPRNIRKRLYLLYITFYIMEG